MEEARPRGRRPAGSDTRGAIVEAAREEFARRGYGAASMRAIARSAGVDPALVRHYFPTRDELFVVSILPAGVEPALVAERVVDGGLDGLGARLLTEVLSVWGADGGVRFRVAIGTMTGADSSPITFFDYLRRVVFDRVVRLLPDDDAALRMQLVASQLAGVLTLRYLLRAEPLASMPVPEVARLVGPTLDRYLREPLPTAP